MKRVDVVSVLAGLAGVVACHRAPPVAHDAGSGSGPRDVGHFLHAAFALRDAARGSSDEQLATHAEAAWLGANIAWDLVAALGASRGLAEAPNDVATSAWPAALDGAEHTASDAALVVGTMRTLGDDAGRDPCTFLPPTAGEASFLAAYLTFEALPPGVGPSVEGRVARYRVQAAAVTDFVVARCAGGIRALAFGRLPAGGSTRLVPIVMPDRPRPVR